MAQLEGATKSAQSLHWTLFKLRGKLMRRKFGSQTGRWVSVILGLVFILPMVAGIGIGSWAGYTHAPGQWPVEIMGIILFIAWTIWLVLPIVATPLSEGMSFERLLIYPVRARDMVLANILGTAFDFQTYLVLPVFVAMVVGFGGFGRISNPDSTLLMLPLVLVATIIAYATMVATSQLALTALGGILQSRRFRDVIMVIFSLLGFSCWFITQLFGRAMEWVSENVSVESGQLPDIAPLDVLQWTPPGAMARSIGMALDDNWLLALAWLGYGLVWFLLIAWAWSRLLTRLMTGNGYLIGSGATEPKPEKQVVRRRRENGLLARWFSAETLAIANKELISAWRIPQRRIATLQSLAMPLFLFVIFLFNEGGQVFQTGFVRYLVPFYVVFTGWILGQNMIGWEHRGLSALLLSPVPRSRIFLGKSLAAAVIGGLPFGLIGLAIAVFTRDVMMVLWTALALTMISPVMAVSSIVSARFPFPVALDYKTNRNSFSSGGCVAAIVSIFVLPIGVGILIVPMLAPMVIDHAMPQWSAVIPILTGIAFGYSYVVLRVGTRWAGETLIDREPEALEATKPLDSD